MHTHTGARIHTEASLPILNSRTRLVGSILRFTYRAGKSFNLSHVEKTPAFESTGKVKGTLFIIVLCSRQFSGFRLILGEI